MELSCSFTVYMNEILEVERRKDKRGRKSRRKGMGEKVNYCDFCSTWKVNSLPIRSKSIHVSYYCIRTVLSI